MVDRWVTRVVVASAVTSWTVPATSQTFEFPPMRSNPEVVDAIERQAQGEESADDVIFENCETIGVKIDLSDVPQFSSYTSEQKLKITKDAEKTIAAVSTQKGCSIIYTFDNSKSEMRILINPRSRIEYMNLEGEESGGALLQYCTQIDPHETGGVFTLQMSDNSDPEPVNTSTLSFCEAGVPVRLEASCGDVADNRCQDESLIRSIRKALRIVAVPISLSSQE